MEIYIMTYSDDLKSRIINAIKMKKYTDIELIKLFGVSRKTFYKFKNELTTSTASNSKRHTKRNTKINMALRNYIKKYVTRNINFNYKKLITLVNKKFNISISKSSIYDILKKANIKKRNFTKGKFLLILTRDSNKLRILKNK